MKKNEKFFKRTRKERDGLALLRVLFTTMTIAATLLAAMAFTGCASTNVAGPVDGGVSYGIHRDINGIMPILSKANLQKVNVDSIEDISGDLAAIATFSAVAVEGDWVIGNYVAKGFGMKFQKAAKVKKDLYKDPE